MSEAEMSFWYMPTPKDDGSIFSSSLMGSFMRLAKLTADRQPMSMFGSSFTASALADHTDAPASHTNVNSTPLESKSPVPPLRSRQIAKHDAKNVAVSLPPQPFPMTTRVMWCALMMRRRVARAASACDWGGSGYMTLHSRTDPTLDTAAVLHPCLKPGSSAKMGSPLIGGCSNSDLHRE